MAEMKMGLMYVTTFIAALALACIYGWLVGSKSLQTGFKYGPLYGVAVGVEMGYGTYSVMPIPYSMALTWFLGTVWRRPHWAAFCWESSSGNRNAASAGDQDHRTFLLKLCQVVQA
jgi:hypothetical protein